MENKDKKKPLIILTGPTAVGKTALSIALAKAVDGEIISADSMQVYRGMDIGTAKITPLEMDGISHYLIDVLEPEESFDVTRFQQMAKQAMEQIYQKGKIPIVVGGTGFYIQALLYDIDFHEQQPDTAYRDSLWKLYEQHGPQYLHAMLEQVDVQASQEIHYNNVKRVIRALEYFHLTGQPISKHNAQQRERSSPYRYAYFVLNQDRQVLYDRIDQRIDQMLDAGLISEVQMLYERGCHKGMVSMEGLGYKEILSYLMGECTLEEAVYTLKRDTRHFAKRQITWFKREKEVIWLDKAVYPSERDLLEKILLILQQKEICNNHIIM